MNLSTPARVFNAVQSPAGRLRYRRALRERVWRALGSLPFGLRFNATLDDVFQVRINSRDSVISRSIFVNGEWEPSELDFIRSYVKPGMIAFDVGGNLGAHTLTLAASVGPSGHVHSFEPTGVFETLSYNVRQNGFAGRVSLNHCAVGEHDGTIRLLTCKPGLELFTSRETPLVPEASTGQYAEYPVITLDSYTRARGIDHIDFLKVDVEGAEDFVFQGCADLFARRAIGCIMFELNEVCMTDVGDSAVAMVERIRSAGYRLAMVDPAGQFLPLPETLSGVFNIVATPESAPVSRDHLASLSSSSL